MQSLLTEEGGRGAAGAPKTDGGMTVLLTSAFRRLKTRAFVRVNAATLAHTMHVSWGAGWWSAHMPSRSRVIVEGLLTITNDASGSEFVPGCPYLKTTKHLGGGG